MYDQSPSPASSSCAAVRRTYHRRSRHVAAEEDDGKLCGAECMGKSCQACTAWAIADCVALCCCPCAVVNLLTLTFLKLPWTVARRYIHRRKKEKNRRIREKERERGGRDTDGISREERVKEGKSGNVWEEGVMDNLGSVFSAEEIWLELYEVQSMLYTSHPK